MGLEKARIKFLAPTGEDIVVKYNPTQLAINRGVHYAEVTVPGLIMPLQQFVRGTTQTLNVEVFLDSEPLSGQPGTERPGNERNGPANEVEAHLRRLRELIKINSSTHAPPVVRFEWGQTQFDGVVTTFNEKFSLFDESGNVTRARVELALKSYQDADSQRREINPESPDITKTHVVTDGDRLDNIAAREYGDARLWRVIASANGIEHPREMVPGTVLNIPPLAKE